MRQKQLFPDRPGREELFSIAERWAEQGNASGPIERDVPLVMFASPMMAPMSLGFLFEGPISRMIDQRRAARLREHDERVLATELHCRDIEPFDSIGKMVAHILNHERR